MSHFDFEMDRLRRFGQCTPFGMWEFFVESGVDTTLPPMDQVDEFFTKAVLNFCNDSYAEMYGFESASKLEGKPLSFLFPMNEDNLKFLLDWIASDYRLKEYVSVEHDRLGKPRRFQNTVVAECEHRGDTKFITAALGTQQELDLHPTSAIEPTSPVFEPTEADRVFVISSFAPELNQNVDAIKEACKDYGLEAIRVDQQISSESIIRRIHDNLLKASYVIADLTHARPNCYYEIGFFDALLLARQVSSESHLLLVAQDISTDAHFDLRHRGIQQYDNAFTLMRTVQQWFHERGLKKVQ